MANKKAKKDLNWSSQKHIAKFSDETLEKISIQDFNKQLRQLPEGLKQKYRKRRRILKNRKYALKCRRKGSEATDNIAEQNRALELEISRVSEELQKVTNERDELKVKCARLNAMLSGMQSPARRKLPDNSRASQQM
ncbi:neural retina-specific leucine zipper protein-like [Montipora foliosa]|uniref:neural retina-specific leucine zipper protein-like n=1 Tax=Montipora foliosa TaxID=591990 RepID=UPI0035F1AC34